MKKIIITTRVVHDKKYAVDKDYLDKDYLNYFEKLGYLVFLMPNFNNLRGVDKFIDTIKPDAIILSGGNNITPKLYGRKNISLPDTSAIRDANEMRLLEIAEAKYLKVLGICRGMQMLNVYFGGKIINLNERLPSNIGHVKTAHKIVIKRTDKIIGFKKGVEKIVNSFHNYGFTKKELGRGVVCMAEAKDGVIEAIKHVKLPILGILWHPERSGCDANFNIRLIKGFLKA